MNFKISNNLLTILTTFFSIIFIGKAFFNLMNYGSDFLTSYSLAKLFWNGIDVYTLDHKNPFYPHIWYITLFPFTFFEFKLVKIIFFIFNLFFFFGSIFILRKKLNLNSFETKILIIMSVISTPFTNLIALGNLSLMTLFFLLVYFFYSQVFLKAIALSLAFIKYNVSFFFLFLPFLQKKIKLSLVFIIVNIAAVVLYHYYLDIRDPLKAFDPFLGVFQKVNEQIDLGDNGVNYGLFNLHNFLIDLNISNYYYLLFAIVILVFSYFVLFGAPISKSKLLTVTCLITSAFIYHGLFDFVILIPVLAYTIKHRSKLKYSLIYFFSIINIFYLYKINILFNNFISKEIYSTFGMMLLILSIILLIFFEEDVCN